MKYRDAGVDIDRGDAWVNTIKTLIGRRGSSLPSASIGGFSGLFNIGGGRSIAACCDGVGTKLALAETTGMFRGLGQDLVAMSVNDLVTCGASPLFFLDYIACAALDEAKMESVLEGVLDACIESRCALLGGETAEMPGVYPDGGFDLAGFAVGIVDDDKAVDGRDIACDDVIVGLPSSGLHSNGYSLVRKVLSGAAYSLGSRPDTLAGETLGEVIMRPTRVYVRPALDAVRAANVKGMAHITGGGLESNINRVIPDGMMCEIFHDSFDRPEIFRMISAAGVEESEMRKVFNLGIGYAFITDRSSFDKLVDVLRCAGESPLLIGRVVTRKAP
ncbi:MAG: phosphoribosylformylglycinamidine cyclo-ligase [Synergistaceae bacterium]|jgi:phosphoribosylformylglycinamidine cyclo-ligase|nr:phosphoribosylformylglycinamidine cyclo-ligase [Synergistaceae bacterium]